MTEKGCFIRIGTSAEPMQQKMIDDLFAKRTRNSLGRIKSRKQDLKFEQLKIYYEAAGLSLNEHFASNLELLTNSTEYNYVAYLLADNNSTSIKVAKYPSTTRVDLSENNEYGYACLIRAAKQVLDKIELENPSLTQITSKERENHRLWDPIALREAVINAFVHNDFTGEVPPKFEIFPDRIEITSVGGLPDGLSQKEFFEGYSVPRNKELMRVFKDLDMVEQLGSGIPRILKSYNRSCFSFTNNFLRMIFPTIAHVTPHVTLQVKNLVSIIIGEMTRQELQEKLKLSDRMNFLNNYLQPALRERVIEMTIPDKPKSNKQKYRLTVLGNNLKLIKEIN
jgi:predicted HTH transcriptional regulator